MNPLPFIHFFSMIIYLSIFIYILLKNPKSLLNRVCSAFIFCFVLWSFGAAFSSSHQIQKAYLDIFWNITAIGSMSCAAFFLLFTIVFTERVKNLKLNIIGPLLFVIPIIIIIKKFQGYIIIDTTGTDQGIGYWEKSIWSLFFFVYMFSYFFISLWMAFSFARKTINKIKKRQILVIYVAMIVTVTLSTVFEVILPILNIFPLYTLSNIISLIWVLAMAYSIYKYQFLGKINVELTQMIIMTMPDAMFILDKYGKIVSANDQALELTDSRGDELVGVPMTELMRFENAEEENANLLINSISIRHIEATLKIKDNPEIPIRFSSSHLMNKFNENTYIICIATDITEYREKEKQLVEREKKYRSILENIKEGYFEVDLKGDMTFFNDSVCEMLGYSPEKVIGKNYMDFTHPDYSKSIYSHFITLFKTGTPAENIDYEIVRSDGRVRTMELSAGLIRDDDGKQIGFHGVVRDISLKKEAEEKLRKSEERYRTILTSIHDGYYEVDLKGNFIFFNQGFLNLIGYSKEEIRNLNYKEIGDVNTVDYIFNVFKDVYDEKTIVGEANFGFVHKDGSVRSTEISISLIRDADERKIGFRGIARDVTERNILMQSIKESQETLKRRNDQIEKDLETAQLIQKSLVSVDIPHTPGVDIVFRYLPLDLVSTLR